MVVFRSSSCAVTAIGHICPWTKIHSFVSFVSFCQRQLATCQISKFCVESNVTDFDADPDLSLVSAKSYGFFLGPWCVLRFCGNLFNTFYVILVTVKQTNQPTNRDRKKQNLLGRGMLHYIYFW